MESLLDTFQSSNGVFSSEGVHIRPFLEVMVKKAEQYVILYAMKYLNYTVLLSLGPKRLGGHLGEM